MYKKIGLLFITLSILSLTVMAGEKNTAYFSTKVVHGSMDEVQEKTAEALKEVGFGIISTLNLDQKINEKTGSNLKPYRLLGVCNPKYALEAIEKESNIGLFLPCKIILKDIGNGNIEVVLGNPDFIMSSLKNDKLDEVGKKVAHKLNKALKNIK